MTWDGMSPTFRPPSHDLACEPDEVQRDLTDRTQYAWASQPPPCRRCQELEAEIAELKRRLEGETFDHYMRHRLGS